MKQGQLPTLLEWLRSKDEAYMKTLLDSVSLHAFTFMSDLKYYGLAAFDRLPATTQKFIMQTYCSIYHD